MKQKGFFLLIYNAFIVPLHKARFDVLVLYLLLSIVVILSSGSPFTIHIVLLLFVFISIGVAQFFLNRIFDIREDSISQASFHIENSHFYLIAMTVLTLVPLTALYYFKEPILPIVVIIFFGVFYSVPIFKGKRIKNLFFIKNIWAAIGTYSIFVIFSYYYIPTFLQLNQVLIMLIPLFVLALTYEILMDVKDMDGDRAARVITIPNKFGVLYTQIAILAIILSLMFYLMFFFNFLALLSAVLVAIATLYVNEKRGLWYYYGVFYSQNILILMYILIFS